MSVAVQTRPQAAGSTPALDADVLIAGYGPVGQSLAALLGQAGHRVIVCERRSGRYETPRAGHFDHEIMRIFQSLGVAEKVGLVADPARLYELLDPDGQVVSRLPREWSAPSGWDASYHFYQPELEEVLDELVLGIPNVEVRFETAVVDLQQLDDHVVVELEDGSTLTARYLVGADGANSVVRAVSQIPTEDLGFKGDWLVIDLRRRPGAPEIDIPDTGQVLDPARPNHMGRVAQRYFRWEFMLIDGDDPEEMVKPERVWELLKPWIGPQDGELIRQTVYQFRSVVADSFRNGSVLLAGDAAHLMPPFLGQGMSSGIRDAATLSWILDLILKGTAGPELLDLYTETRRPHVTAYIEESVKIGSVVCETDVARAAQRREDLRAATELPTPFEPPTGAGFRDGDALAGRLGVQPFLRLSDGRVERADDVIGAGFTLLSLEEPDAETAAAIAELHTSIGLRSLVLGPGGAEEDGGALREWMQEAGVTAALVRPDFYVYGSVGDATEVAGLLADLRSALSLTAPRSTEEEEKRNAALRRAMTVTRMLDYGMDHWDAHHLFDAPGTRPWEEVAGGLAAEQLDRAKAAASRGDVETAVACYRRGAAALIFAQLAFNMDNERKRALYRRGIEAYQAAADLDTELQVERLSIPYGSGACRAWFVRSEKEHQGPTVIILGGWSGWGAAYHKQAAALARRGLAALLIEAPGQGETRMLDGIHLSADADRAFSAAIDLLQERTGHDGRFGIWGNSFGGLLAARAAVHDDRFGACCVNGADARPELRPFRTASEQSQALFGVDTDEEVAEILRTMWLDPAADSMEASLLVLHGGVDPLVTLDQQKAFLELSADSSLRVWEDGEHTIYNHSDERTQFACDWFRARLVGA